MKGNLCKEIEPINLDQFAGSQEESAFDRIVEEKRLLDDKIVKLNAFLIDNDKACKIAGYAQVELMRNQLRTMLDYSDILNRRILAWVHTQK